MRQNKNTFWCRRLTTGVSAALFFLSAMTGYASAEDVDNLSDRPFLSTALKPQTTPDESRPIKTRQSFLDYFKFFERTTTQTEEDDLIRLETAGSGSASDVKPVLISLDEPVSDEEELVSVDANTLLSTFVSAPPLPPIDEPGLSPADPVEPTLLNPAQTFCLPAKRERNRGTNKQKFPLSVPLLIADRYVGDIDVNIDPEGRGEVDAERLEDLLKDVVAPEALQEIVDTRRDSQYVDLVDYCDRILGLWFDSDSLELRGDLSFLYMKSHRVSLSSRTTPDPDNFVKPEKFSIGLGTLVNEDLVFGLDDQGTISNLRANFEGYANFGGLNGLSLFFAFDAQEGPGARFRRREIQLVKDNFKKATRFTLGDINPPIRSFQSSVPLAGVSYSRQFSAIQPFRRTVTTGRGTISLERPSEVEVYLNGVLTDRLTLPAGNFNLADFPAAIGANDIELRIEDDLGRVVTRDFSFFSANELLEDGLLDFGVSLGVPRTISQTGFNYGDEVVASGYVNYGLTSRVTLGANAQLRGSRFQIGAEAGIGTPLGVFSAEVTGSRIGASESLTGEEEFGIAAGLAHRALFNIGSIPIDWNSSGFYQSNQFVGVGGTQGNNLSVFQTNVRAVLPYRTNLGFSAGVTRGVGLDQDAERYSLTATKAFDRFSVNLSANQVERRVGDDEFSFLINVSVPFGQQYRTRSSFDTRNRLRALEVARIGRGQVGRFDARAQILGSDLERQVNTDLLYSHNRFDARVEVDYFEDRVFPGRDRVNANFRFGTFIGYAGGEFGIGRPSPEGFVVVKQHKSLKGSGLEVMDGSGFNIEGRPGVLGNALLPIRRAYLPRQFTIEAQSAPAGYDLGETQFNVLPAYGAGYKIQIGSDASRTVVGTLKRADGSPVELFIGSFRRVGEEKTDPTGREFFTNSKGRFAIDGIAPGRYIIGLPDGTKAEFVVGKDTEGLVNVGELFGS